MADEGLRELARRWRQTRALEDEARLLRARLRAGELTKPRVWVAAAVGYPAAMEVVDDPQLRKPVHTTETTFDLSGNAGILTFDRRETPGGLLGLLRDVLPEAASRGRLASLRAHADANQSSSPYGDLVVRVEAWLGADPSARGPFPEHPRGVDFGPYARAGDAEVLLAIRDEVAAWALDLPRWDDPDGAYA